MTRSEPPTLESTKLREASPEGGASSRRSSPRRAGDEPRPAGPSADERRAADPARRRRGRLLLAAFVVLLALTWALVAEPFRIPSESMEPTLRPGDQVLLDKLAYRLGSAHRDDLAVFHSPEGGEISLKRIVGLPGDRIGIEDGVLSVNGHLEREAYVNYRLTDSVYFGPVTVPPGHVFVMGDNRSNSRDSREYGAVSEKALMGRVLLRLWPLSR